MDSKEEKSKDWLDSSHQRASDNYRLSSGRVENFTEPTHESGKNGIINDYSQENQYLKPPSSSDSNRWAYAPPFRPPFVAEGAYHVHQLIPPPYTSEVNRQLQPIPYHGLMAPNPNIVEKRGLHYTNNQYNYSSTIGAGQPIGQYFSLSGPTGITNSATLSSSPTHWSVEDRTVPCGPESVYPPMNNSKHLKTYEHGVNIDTKSLWSRCLPHSYGTSKNVPSDNPGTTSQIYSNTTEPNHMQEHPTAISSMPRYPFYPSQTGLSIDAYGDETCSEMPPKRQRSARYFLHG